jgi:hypothetical protein
VMAIEKKGLRVELDVYEEESGVGLELSVI